MFFYENLKNKYNKYATSSTSSTAIRLRRTTPISTPPTPKNEYKYIVDFIDAKIVEIKEFFENNYDNIEELLKDNEIEEKNF